MRDDPFAKLGALDQKLFSKPTPPPAHDSVVEAVPTPGSSANLQPIPQTNDHPSTNEEDTQIGKEGSRETGKEGSREASFSSQDSSPSPFDLATKPYRKDSYLFTDAEFEAMEDLKIELRRKYDVKAIKNDIARSAIGLLISDFRRNREKSHIVRQLRIKK